jgi:hypothetical protein
MPGDLQYALVLRTTGASSVPMDNQALLALENSPGCLKVTDSQQLEACLQQYTSGDGRQPYQVLFELKGGNSFGGAFGAADAPAFVRQYFARQ